MHAGQSIRQRISGHHHTITQADRRAHDLFDVRRLVARMGIFLWCTDDVIVQLENASGVRVRFDLRQLTGRAVPIPALQQDHIGRHSLDINDRRRLIHTTSNHTPGRFKFKQRLDDPVMSCCGTVDR
ncbi:hypothetical protein D3C76_1393510 [compost metagenome]